MILPPVPKWKSSTDDFDSNDFYRRSLDFERSLFPADAVFPREGQLWQAVENCEVYWHAWIPKTIMPGGTVRLERGEQVRIIELDDPKPIQVRFQPVRYKDLEATIVPAD